MQRPVTLLLVVTATISLMVPLGASGGGTDFSISIATDHDSVAVGSAVKVRATVTNTSTHGIWLPVSLQPQFNDSFTVIHVTDDTRKPAAETTLYRRVQGLEPDRVIEHPAENGKPAWTERQFSSLPVRSVRSVQLKPGEAVRDEIVVSDLFDLSKPSKYSIQLALVGTPRVKSNVIIVTVTP